MHSITIYYHFKERKEILLNKKNMHIICLDKVLELIGEENKKQNKLGFSNKLNSTCVLQLLKLLREVLARKYKNHIK